MSDTAQKVTTPATDTGSAEAASPKADKVEARRRAILDVAKDIFLTQGYAEASMSEIAARVGGSKGTLYNYFRSKEELFAAFMVDVCQGPANVAFQHLPEAGDDFHASLVQFGELFLNFVLSGPTMAVHRLVVAEAGRFPELGRIFYENGPKRGEAKLAAFFQKAMDAGMLRPGDPLTAARWFRDLTLANVYSRALWGVLEPMTPDQVHRHEGEAADIFLKAFGPESD